MLMSLLCSLINPVMLKSSVNHPAQWWWWRLAKYITLNNRHEGGLQIQTLTCHAEPNMATLIRPHHIYTKRCRRAICPLLCVVCVCVGVGVSCVREWEWDWECVFVFKGDGFTLPQGMWAKPACLKSWLLFWASFPDSDGWKWFNSRYGFIRFSVWLKALRYCCWC